MVSRFHVSCKRCIYAQIDLMHKDRRHSNDALMMLILISAASLNPAWCCLYVARWIWCLQAWNAWLKKSHIQSLAGVALEHFDLKLAISQHKLWMSIIGYETLIAGVRNKLPSCVSVNFSNLSSSEFVVLALLHFISKYQYSQINEKAHEFCTSQPIWCYKIALPSVHVYREE
jgi:hypothetical protein